MNHRRVAPAFRWAISLAPFQARGAAMPKALKDVREAFEPSFTWKQYDHLHRKSHGRRLSGARVPIARRTVRATLQESLQGTVSSPTGMGPVGDVRSWTGEVEMAKGVDILTPRGREARADEASAVPPQLRQLLNAIDGQRNRQEILAMCGRSAVNAGGLSWLVSAGYVEKVAAPKVPAPMPMADTVSDTARAPAVMAVPVVPAAPSVPAPMDRRAPPPRPGPVASVAPSVPAPIGRRGEAAELRPSPANARTGPTTDVGL